MQDARRPGKSYCWVTWISGLLAGSDHCEWKAWFRAHYQHYAKLPRGGDLDAWIVSHDRMVVERAAKLEAEGFSVSVEDFNKFSIKGSACVLGGKPDIVAFKGTTARIVDVKSGTPRPSDEGQVLLYMFAIPFLDTLERYRAHVIGEVEYRGSRVEIPLSRLDAAMKSRIVTLLQTVGGELEPPRVPSVAECQFCDIASCPDRAKEKTGATKAF